MNIIRKFKLSEIIDVSYNNVELKIFNFLDYKLKDLSIFIDESFPNQLNYMKNNNTFIFQYDKNAEIVWFRYEGFIEYLEYEMSDIHIMKLLEILLFKQYNIKTERYLESIYLSDKIEEDYIEYLIHKKHTRL